MVNGVSGSQFAIDGCFFYTNSGLLNVYDAALITLKSMPKSSPNMSRKKNGEYGPEQA